jgi:hypothetical protein
MQTLNREPSATVVQAQPRARTRQVAEYGSAWRLAYWHILQFSNLMHPTLNPELVLMLPTLNPKP